VSGRGKDVTAVTGVLFDNASFFGQRTFPSSVQVSLAFWPPAVVFSLGGDAVSGLL